MPTSPRGLARGQQFSRAAASKPSGGIRLLHSLSAWGLPTPLVALACTCSVGSLRCHLCRRSSFLNTAFASLQLQASPEREGEPPLGGGGVLPCSITSGTAASKPSGGIRSLHSLSAWGLPTPLVALACIGNVSIQAFSGAGGQCYFVRRLQVCSYKPPLKGEGDQRSWWRGLPPQQPTGFTKSYASFFLC